MRMTNRTHTASVSEGSTTQVTKIKMTTAPVMTTAGAHDPSEQCDWFREGNMTEPRVTADLDVAGCLFLSILPYGQAVPALIWTVVLLTLLSFMVNSFTLFGLGRSEDLSWEPRVAFFKNLILSDILQTLAIGPTVVYSLVQRRTIAFGTWCHIQYFVGTVCIFSSLLSITCMALERYLYVCHAIHYLVILTQMRLRLALSLIWVYAISVSTVHVVLLHMGSGQKNELFTGGLLCEPDMMEQYLGFPRASAVFRKLLGSFTLLMCLLAHAFSYLSMYRDAMAPFDAVNTRARKTVLFYCGMLFPQLLPPLLKVSTDALWEVKGTEAMMAPSNPTPSATAAVLHMSLLVILLVPPIINPLVYGLRNAEMRKALLRRFRRRTERRYDVGEMRVGNIAPRNRGGVD